jgi:UDP-3-O-[3-hydroxymyristoyl] glucosamine N-acyltransferase
MAGQTGVAGSSKIGRNCMFGGQVGISGHLKVADGTKIGAQSGIPSDVKKENSVLLGYPAMDHRNFLRSSIVFRQLPELKTKIEELERKVDQLKNA